MAWWVWCVLGIVLLMGELLTSGFFVVFFGLASLAVGLITAVRPSLPAWAQGGLFSVIAVASLALFRGKLLEKFKPAEHLARSLADLIGGVATASDALAPGAIGKAEFRGTPWTAKNIGEAPLAKGERCVVEGVDGLMLRVRAEHQGNSRV